MLWLLKSVRFYYLLLFLPGMTFVLPATAQERPLCKKNTGWWLQLQPEWQDFFCAVYMREKGEQKITCTELRKFLWRLKNLDTLPAVQNLEPLSVCRNLETLDVRYHSASDVLTSLKGIETLKHLRVLNIMSGGRKVESLDKVLRNLKKLEVLSLYGLNIKHIGKNDLPRNIRKMYIALGLDNLEFLQSLQKIEEIGFSGSGYGQETVRLEELVGLKQLNSLSFFYCGIETPGKSVAFKKLRFFWIYSALGELDISFLAHSKKLEFLKLSSCLISGDIKGTFGALKNLKSLYISFVNVGPHRRIMYNSGAEDAFVAGFFVPGQGYLTSLQELTMSGSRIMSHLEYFKQLKRLRYLCLDGSRLRKLDGIEQLTSLNSLYCRDCEHLGDATPLLNGRMDAMEKVCFSGSDLPPQQDSILRTFASYCKTP